MRLIDADALLTDRHMRMYYHLPNGDTAIPIIDIEHAPTIEERKKGAWMPHPNREFREWDICTACGVGCKRRDYEDGGMTEYNYHYCPNCGADMRGDGDA